MEKKFLKYTLILVIFFIGLSLGVNFQENSKTQEIQDELNDFENDIQNPNNQYPDDFNPVNPSEEQNNQHEVAYKGKIKRNAFNSLAKDGERLIKGGIHLIFEKSGDFFKVIFKQGAE